MHHNAHILSTNFSPHTNLCSRESVGEFLLNYDLREAKQFISDEESVEKSKKKKNFLNMDKKIKNKYRTNQYSTENGRKITEKKFF